MHEGELDKFDGKLSGYLDKTLYMNTSKMDNEKLIELVRQSVKLYDLSQIP